MTHDMHDIDGPSEFEREFGAMLRQAGGGFKTDSQALAEGGLRRGKVRLWRRRAAMVTGAAAVAAVAVAAVQLPGGGGGGNGESLDVAEAPQTQSELIATLTAMLPEGISATASYATTPEESGDPSVSLEFGTGQEAFSLDVSMLRWQASDWRSVAGCDGYDWDGAEQCEQTELEDGSVLSVGNTRFDESTVVDPGTQFAESDMEEGWEGTYYSSWNALLEMPASWGPSEEGLWRIGVSLTSMSDEAPDPGVEPPISQDRLAEIARESVWQEVLAVADAEHGAPEESLDNLITNSDVPGEQLRSLFRDLAPGGLEIGEGLNESQGYTSFDVRAGEASAMVEVNAWPADSFTSEDGPTGDPECQLDTREDGTRVFLCDRIAAEDYDPQIYADVYYVDGSSIDITVYPGEGSDSPLTLEELGEIAGSQEWQGLLG
ncbi:hypothetical protein E1265_18735 [Streptomyces sp. 8K308]|uniref:hypothetical protein n=1 Tax=Streptomyces sp. 8K308 TaxID=2530388 RepID=UPI00104A444E|nr:hypothetical protein [Streptomyces sp. 8K308]TDC21189.1 hypothetical protein E1265_18735 [Streptomyces sp. 8K308]